MRSCVVKRAAEKGPWRGRSVGRSMLRSMLRSRGRSMGRSMGRAHTWRMRSCVSVVAGSARNDSSIGTSMTTMSAASGCFSIISRPAATIAAATVSSSSPRGFLRNANTRGSCTLALKTGASAARVRATPWRVSHAFSASSFSSSLIAKRAFGSVGARLCFLYSSKSFCSNGWPRAGRFVTSPARARATCCRTRVCASPR